MRKVKDKGGRRTNLQVIQDAAGKAAPVPRGIIPVPQYLERLLKGRSAADIMKEAAPFCAHYLYNCIVTQKFKPSWARIDVAKYIIDQVEGKARIRAELTGAGGAPLSWQALVVLAEKAEELERLGQRLGPPLSAKETGKSEPTGVEVEGEVVNSEVVESHLTPT